MSRGVYDVVLNIILCIRCIFTSFVLDFVIQVPLFRFCQGMDGTLGQMLKESQGQSKDCFMGPGA